MSRAPASTAPAVPTAARPHGASAADRPDTPGTPKAIADLIAERLAGLGPVHVDLRDDSAAHAGHAGAAGGAGHFSVTVVSERFAGVARLARHRAVLDRVADLIPHPVHALAIRAYTPDEFFTSHERNVR